MGKFANVARGGHDSDSGKKGRAGAPLKGPMYAKRIPVKVIGLPSNTETINQNTKAPTKGGKVNPANPAQ